MTRTATESERKAPTKPTLEIEQHPEYEKGICLDPENTEKLLDYIHRLERGYE